MICTIRITEQKGNLQRAAATYGLKQLRAEACRPADQTSTSPFFTPRLQALRRSLRWGALIMTVFSSRVRRPARPSTARIRPVRDFSRTGGVQLLTTSFPTLYSFLCEPNSRGASRQCKPLRLMKIVPLSTRRFSIRGLPCDVGKSGSRRATCASVS